MASYIFALVALATLCAVIAIGIVRGGKFPEEFEKEYLDDGN
ncbi:hypothetical protein [Vreelandella sp. H-I2]